MLLLLPFIMSPPKRTSEALAKLDKFFNEERDQAGEGATHGGYGQGPGGHFSVPDNAYLQNRGGEGDICLIRQDINKLRERESETKRRVSHMEDEIPPLQVTTERLQHQLNSVLGKQDDMENRHCHCNLRFVGLTERAEGPDPPCSLRTCLSKTTAERPSDPCLWWSALIAWLHTLPRALLPHILKLL